MQLAEALEDGLLADAPLGGLDELEDPDVPALVPRPDREAERSGRLALPLPVWTITSGRLRRCRVVRPSSGTVSG
ncbi:hypothetical protein C6I20_00025 [Aeromicrobium sp. A1-2]|nr:hypothetical protein C6I20_00025 [Aeromicrobium sp. A1-2]